MKIGGAILLALGIITAILLSAMCTLWWYDYQSNCGDYMKLAADAPSIDKATDFLGKSVSYMEGKGLTSGNSAFIFSTPSSDVGIWYNQAKDALQELQSTQLRVQADSASVSKLEKDNALMKLRETLLDDSGQSGTSVTEPNLITWFPKQWLIVLGWLLSFSQIIIGATLIKLS